MYYHAYARTSCRETSARYLMLYPRQQSYHAKILSVLENESQTKTVAFTHWFDLRIKAVYEFAKS